MAINVDEFIKNAIKEAEEKSNRVPRLKTTENQYHSNITSVVETQEILYNPIHKETT